MGLFQLSEKIKIAKSATLKKVIQKVIKETHLAGWLLGAFTLLRNRDRKLLPNDTEELTDTDEKTI